MQLFEIEYIYVLMHIHSAKCILVIKNLENLECEEFSLFLLQVKPYALKEKGVRVARCVQQPRQFVVVFPDVYTATVCCGYNVSESVHYATTEWLSVSMEAAKVGTLYQNGVVVFCSKFYCSYSLLTMVGSMAREITVLSCIELLYVSAFGFSRGFFFQSF